MANNENLIPAKPGEVRNPKGKPKGTRNRATILREVLIDMDVVEMGLIKNMPEYLQKTGLRNFMDLMTVVQAKKAIQDGDTSAFAALNKAMGDVKEVTGEIELKGARIEFVDKPEAISPDPELP